MLSCAQVVVLTYGAFKRHFRHFRAVKGSEMEMETAISGVKWGGNGLEMEMETASHFPVSEGKWKWKWKWGLETAFLHSLLTHSPARRAVDR